MIIYFLMASMMTMAEAMTHRDQGEAVSQGLRATLTGEAST